FSLVLPQGPLDNICCPFEIRCRVLQTEEACFKLGGCEVDPVLKAKVEKFTKRHQVRFHRIGKTPDRLFREEKAKHRTEAVKLVVSAQAVQDISDPTLHLAAKHFEPVPAIY